MKVSCFISLKSLQNANSFNALYLPIAQNSSFFSSSESRKFKCSRLSFGVRPNCLPGLGKVAVSSLPLDL